MLLRVWVVESAAAASSLHIRQKALGTNTTEQAFALIKESVVCVMTEEERIPMSETRHEEFQEFLESMTQEQFGRVREYVESIPKLTHTAGYTCSHCNAKNEMLLEGMQSFL